MKPKASLRSFLALAGSALLLASQAHAQTTYYWDNNGDTVGFGTASGTWSSTGSLFSTSITGETTPTGTDVTTLNDPVHFGTNVAGNGLGTGTITVDGNVNSADLNFGTQTTGTITFDAVNGGTITTGNRAIRVNGTGATAIFNADFVGATTQWFGNSTTVHNALFKNTGTNTIRVNHTLQFGSNATLDLLNGTRGINYLLSAGQTATIKYSSVNDGLMGGIGNNGDSSSGVFIKDGSASSTLRLAADNSFLGEYRIEAGTMQFARRGGLYGGVDTSWLASKIKVGNTGVLGLNVGGTNQFTTTDVTTLLANLGGANGTDTTGFAAGSAIGFDTTNAAGGTFTVADVIADSTGTGGGAIGVRKLGTGELVLTNTSTYTGATRIRAGTLAIGPLASINNSADISIAAGATLDVSQQTSPYTLSASTTLTASGTGTTAGTWARIIGPSGGVVSLGAQAVTLTWGGATSGTDTESPSLLVSQGELTLNNNAFTINGASTLGEGTYRLIQVGDGATGTLNENGTPSYAVSGSAISGSNTNVISSDGSGNLILTVTAGGGGSPYDTWAITNGNAPTGGPDDDYDGDGVSNAIEFVLGGDKDTNDLGKLPTAATVGTDMTFTFERDEASVDASVAVTIEVSNDLVTWDAGSSPYTVPDTATAGPPVEVVDNGDTHTVTLTVTKAPDTKKFARLKVVITP